MPHDLIFLETRAIKIQFIKLSTKTSSNNMKSSFILRIYYFLKKDDKCEQLEEQKVNLEAEVTSLWTENEIIVKKLINQMLINKDLVLKYLFKDWKN